MSSNGGATSGVVKDKKRGRLPMAIGTPCPAEGGAPRADVKISMIDLKYSLVIEATEDPNFFGFYSPDLEGFTGVGHSIEDCLYKAKWGMEEHIALLKERGFPIPDANPDPRVVIQNARRAVEVA